MGERLQLTLAGQPIAAQVVGILQPANALTVERQGLNRLQAMSARLGWGGADVIIRSLQGLILLWFVIGGAFAAILTLPLDNNLLITLQNALLVIAIASGTLIAARLAVGLVRYFSETKGAGNLTSLFEMLT